MTIGAPGGMAAKEGVFQPLTLKLLRNTCIGSQDEWNKGIAETGGIFDLCYVNGFVGDLPKGGSLTPPIQGIDIIDYLRTLIPVDNIGLSTDAMFGPPPIGDFMRARLAFKLVPVFKISSRPMSSV